MLDDRYSNVSAFNDRHGKRRYRYRKGKIAVSLPGSPGEPRFDEAYLRAVNGDGFRRPRGSTFTSQRGLDERRLSFLDHYTAPALKRAKTRSLRQDVEFDLTAGDFAALMDIQSWKCAVSGMDFVLRNMDSDRSQHAFRPSLDRIIPAKGYVIGNVRIVCEIVNIAMNNWGETPLIEMAKAITANRVV
jgi:hypothetical protein